MRKILPLVLLSILISCSSDSSEGGTDNVLDLSIDLDRSVFGIDERITINASSTETLSAGCIGSDFFNSNMSTIKRCLLGDVGNEFQINFSFQDAGTKTFFVEAQTGDGRVRILEKEIEIDLVTNTVRISKVTLNSYPSMGLPFGPTDSDTDPERLADLYFQINKRYIMLSVGDDAPLYSNFIDLPISEIHENESSFEWNFEGDELLFSVDNILHFQLFDFDGEPRNTERFVDTIIILRDFASEKPNQINIVEGLLDVTFDLEWN